MNVFFILLFVYYLTSYSLVYYCMRLLEPLYMLDAFNSRWRFHYGVTLVPFIGVLFSLVIFYSDFVNWKSGRFNQN